jgi:hypothetical protein
MLAHNSVDDVFVFHGQEVAIGLGFPFWRLRHNTAQVGNTRLAMGEVFSPA